jgi:LacI family transcriptional regulator, galactose operon repressor
LILIDIGNSLFVDIARGAEAAAGQAQLKLLLATSDSTRTKQDNYLELFDQARVAGVLLTPLEDPLDAAYAVLSHGRPVILVIATSADPLTCSVMINEELGGYLAATHLLHGGARRLAFLAGLPALRLIRRRLAGVERAVAEAGASLGVVEAPDLAIGTGREVGRQVLLSQSVDGPVDGVVCPSDLLAVGVIQAATELGIRVPDELMVVGYDDNHFASESTIPVSSVSLPGYRMGELAIELLLEEIHQGTGHMHRTVMLDPHLIPRRSTLQSHENTL